MVPFFLDSFRLWQGLIPYGAYPKFMGVLPQEFG